MRKVIGSVLAVIFGLWVTGCADINAYKDYTGAYTAYIGAKAQTGGNKLVEIVPNDGKPIVIDAKSFTIYAPQTGDGGIRPPEQIKNSEWVATVDRVMGGALMLSTTAVIGSAVKGIVNSAVTNAGHNSSIITTTNTASTDSHNSIATTNTTNTTTNNTTTTTTTTDSHNTTTDDHSQNNSGGGTLTNH